MPRFTIVRAGAVVLAAGVAVMTIAACSGSGGAATTGAAMTQTQGAPAAQAAAAGGAAENAAGSAAGSNTSDNAADPANLDGVTLGTAKIRSAELTVVIAHGQPFAARADDAETIALSAGGEVDADDRTAGASPTATIVLRVPPAQLAPVLNRLDQLGKEQSRHLTTVDVTEKVADVTSRVASAGEAIARLRVLYTHAVKVSDVIAIEAELSSREGDLESLEAQQRALATQTAMASITVSFVSGAAPVVKHRKQNRSGFVGGLANGWDAFTATATGVATAAGAALPFLAVVLALALAGRFAWTMWARNRPGRPGSDSNSSGSDTLGSPGSPATSTGSE